MRKPFVAVDMSQIVSIDHLHEILYQALDFPSWYGKNWDAFWDAITALVEMPEHLQLISLGRFCGALPTRCGHHEKVLERYV
jgi:ribonuclease inhibitor